MYQKLNLDLRLKFLLERKEVGIFMVIQFGFDKGVLMDVIQDMVFRQCLGLIFMILIFQYLSCGDFILFLEYYYWV